MHQHYFIEPFAISGTFTAVPNATDPSGFVSYTQGWTLDYQRDLNTDPLAKSPTYQNFNALGLDITLVLQDYQQNGTSEFITSADNNSVAFPYRYGALTRYSVSGNAPFHLYLNLLDNNTALPTGAGWLDLTAVMANRRIKLTANINMFVNPSTGNDANDGLTTGTAYATLNGADANIRKNYDLGGFDITVECADHLSGNYVPLLVDGPYVGGGMVLYSGNTTTPSNVTINQVNTSCVVARNGASISVQGFKCVSTGSGPGQGFGIDTVSAGTTVSIVGNMEMASCASGHFSSASSSQIGINAGYIESGTSGSNFLAISGGDIVIQAINIDVTANPTYTQAYAVVSACGTLGFGSPTWSSGTVTGSKYAATLNGVINTQTGNVNFLPGSSAGSTATGGQYS